MDDLQRVVKEDKKTRYNLQQEADGLWYIRANQGHSMAVSTQCGAPVRVRRPAGHFCRFETDSICERDSDGCSWHDDGRLARNMCA